MNIGLIGKYGSGKTTAANYLIEQFGYVKYSLADPMRQICKDIFGIESKTDPRYRRIMQKLGTDWFRSEDPDVWVRHLRKRVANESKSVVVDDVRFLNEAKALLDNGWMLIYLECPLEVRMQRCVNRDGHFDPSTLNHPSEMDVDRILSELGNRPNFYGVSAAGTAEEMNAAIEELINYGA